jgi:hypothetical protein
MAKNRKNLLTDLPGQLSSGFVYGEFANLDDKVKRKLITLMARISEKSYRRGFQQGFEQNHPVTVNVMKWRFDRSLDSSPSPFGYSTDKAINRLKYEVGLYDLGFYDLGSEVVEPDLPEWLREADHG